MKKTIRYLLPVLLFSSMIFIGCPDNKTIESEKETTQEGAIEKWTEKTAKDAVDQLKEPIDNARALKVQTDDRLSDITEKLNEP